VRVPLALNGHRNANPLCPHCQNPLDARNVPMINDSFEFIEITWIDDVAVITLLDGENRRLFESWKRFREELNSFTAAHDSANVVIDFRNVHYLNSPVKSDVTVAAVRANRDGVKWRFCAMPEPIHESFTISKVDRHVPIHESRSEAVAAFAN
jgi:anti-anti-sigma regulatory factor